MTIRDVGLAVVRAAPWLERVGRWVYMRLPEFLHDTPTSRLREHFAEAASVTFVQIGAHDGLSGDPIRPLILENDGWSGVLIEPQPDIFEQLQRNYNKQSARLQFLNVAISDEAGEKTLFYFSEAERRVLALPDWSSQLASFSPDHLCNHFPHAALAEHSAKIVTFDRVAERLPEEHVDVVIIDTEGHERVIVESIDFDRHRVKFMIYEHRHLPESDRLAVEQKLRCHGFSVKRFGWDTIGWRALMPAVQRSA